MKKSKRKGNQIPLRVWMLQNGLGVVKVADHADLDPSYVSHYLAGRRRGPAVEKALLDLGCPQELLVSSQP